MPLVCQELNSFRKNPEGLVVRPPSSTGSSSGGAPQTLVFFGDEVRELLIEATGAGNAAAAGAGTGLRVRDRLLQVTGRLHRASHSVWEPTSDSVFFAEGASAIKRLDRSNVISLVAGVEGQWGQQDGRAEAARFDQIVSLAADGKGNVFVAEAKAIRMLDVRTSKVTTLRSSKPVGGRSSSNWTSITYDAASDVLVASTRATVCHIPLSQPSSTNGAPVAPRLVSDFEARGLAGVTSVLACAGGTALVGDDGKLYRVDAAGRVTTNGDREVLLSVSYGHPARGRTPHRSPLLLIARFGPRRRLRPQQ